MTKHRKDFRGDILEYIIFHEGLNGYPPTVGELAIHFGTVKSNIYHHLVVLEKEGAIWHVPGKARSWVIRSDRAQDQEQPV